MAKEILVFGSINQDFFSYVERFPRPGESVRGMLFRMDIGGKGTNQAVAAARLGANVKIVAMVGDDMFADECIKKLKAAGVKTDLVGKASDIHTGGASITVDEKGENNIVITPGANFKLYAKRAHELEKEISSAGLILCQSEILDEANLAAFQIAKKHGITTLFNPAPIDQNLDRSILPLTDIICANETETEFITQKELKSPDDFKKAAVQMLDYGPRLAVITLGKQGAIVAERQPDGKNVSIEHVSASKVDAIDSTGAGDCFMGALAYFLANKPDLSAVEAAERAAKISSISVTKRGCQSSYPTKEEVKDLL